MKLSKTKKVVIIIIVMVVSFVALFFLFHMPAETPTPGLFKKSTGLFGGWNLRHEFFGALSIAAAFSIVFGLLTYAVILLLFENSY